MNNSDMNGLGPASVAKGLLMGLIALLLAIPLAWMIGALTGGADYAPERALMLTAKVFAVILLIPAILYVIYHRKSTDPGGLALVVLASVSTVLASFYFYWVGFYVFFPADTLLWSESDFVNDILKFHVGYPIYTAQQNNESYVYTPGAQLFTYLLSWIAGKGLSIPFWRGLQLFYVAIASVLGALTCRRLIRMSRGEKHAHHLFYPLWITVLFLVGTNSITNPYVHNLHNDAMALLISMAGYFLLVEHDATGKRWPLLLLILVPSAGFMVKQSIAIWAPLVTGYLLLFRRPRSIRLALVYAAAAFGCLAATMGVSYLIWGEHFTYWVFTAMGNDPISPIRSFQHIQAAWAYFAIGLVGGAVILKTDTLARPLGLWLVWLGLLVIEGYTSGLGWMLNHMGPGSMIAATWLLASLVKLWPSASRQPEAGLVEGAWLRSGIAVGLVGFLFLGMGLMRIPVKHLSDDAYRYVEDIEKEFDGLPPGRVLLGAGTWVYLKDGVVMKDRGICFGNRGYNGTGDFSGMKARLADKYYSKILLRNLDSPVFLYDHWVWRESSGIRQALLDNYHVDKTIKPVEKKLHQEVPFYFFDELTVLVPNKG